ncbi:hypothetical protein D3C71_1023570 [compost metagenome]
MRGVQGATADIARLQQGAQPCNRLDISGGHHIHRTVHCSKRASRGSQQRLKL